MSCNKCMKRQLAHMANEAFKDARVAKKWLTKENDLLNGAKPIDAIVDEGVKPEYVAHVLKMQSAPRA